MRINKNLPISTYYIILVCCIVAIVILITSIGFEHFRTKDFIEIEAQIVDVEKKIDYGIENDSKTSIIKMLSCSYKIDEEIYNVSFRSFFINKKKIGTTIKLYYSPSNYSDIRNHFLIEVAECGLVFFSIFTVLMLFAIHVKRNENYYISPRQ